MANKLFKTEASAKKAAPVTAPDTVNNAGGKAYKFEKKHALAQIAATNCFNGTFYASAENNLKLAKDAAMELVGDPEFIAKVAVYSRDRAYMKDMPAFLTVVLADTDKKLFRKVFRKVIDNGKMLRNVIQMARSGAVTGKKFNMSAGTFRHAIQEWFDAKGSWALFKASIGNDPSMRDILRMSRPKPNTPEKEALFGYFLGKDVEFDRLPDVVRQYETWKKTKEGPVPDVDFRLLDSLGLADKDWTQIAANAPWMMTRMNLNTFARHGVFKDAGVTKAVADRLRDRELIEKARAFPYQLFVAWRETSQNADIPFAVKDALQDAMEIAIDNVPTLPGRGYVCVDTSGSMSSPITGIGVGRHSSSATCVEVAGLIASSVLRKNRGADIYTFNSSAQLVGLNPRDTVITNTQKLAKAGGGTNISAPLRDLNAAGAKGDWVFYVSDMESWIDSGSTYSYYGTGLAEEWKKFKDRNPKARLICCDLTPRGNSQIKTRADVLQVGGWSDSVFDVASSFVEHGFETDHWVEQIEKISLD
jgi:60 kDa SS-A/Ro ribonucleoprotein